MKGVFDRPLFIIVAVVIVMIVIGNISSNSNDATDTYSDTGTSEKDYQEGINLIKEGNWSDASVALVILQKSNYEDSKVLYNYAQAHDSFMSEDYDMADYYMKDILGTYDGPFKDDILKFKQECAQKNETAQKEEEEANKIVPGSRMVRLGMSQEEAISSMGGKPYDINRTVGSYGVHEQWCYNGGVYLYFEDGLLTSWQD